jgi:hypothetical protein
VPVRAHGLAVEGSPTLPCRRSRRGCLAEASVAAPCLWGPEAAF